MASFRTGEDGHVLCAIVCDGAGSAEHGGEGASVICRTMTEALRRHFTSSAALPADEDIWSWVDTARDRLSVAADKRAKARRVFASTLVMVVAMRDSVLTVHVGDGAVVGRSSAADWSTLSPPENGEYASTTYFLTDDPAPRLRISRIPGIYTGLAVFSDGIENLVLDHKTSTPHVPFFQSMFAPLDSAISTGRSPQLSSALSTFLSGSRVCDKTDDDKTLILVSVQ
jgi:hypothetical protein